MGSLQGRRPPYSLLPASARCRRLLALLLLLTGSLLVAAASASATTVTFTPSAKQEFEVPAGVSSVEVRAVGGAGQKGDQCTEDQGSGAGGSGASVVATMPVSAGSKLLIEFGGGGNGGTGTNIGCAAAAALDGGAGGGSSTVALSGPGPLVIAGGGGGGGASGGFGHPAREEEEEEGPSEEVGGAGASASGSVAKGSYGFRVGELGGVQGGGGYGGTASAGGEPGAMEPGGVNNWESSATAGVSGKGGVGGGVEFSGPTLGGGGGGGGGHFGGGGGGSGNTNGGGGGAGSSFMNGASSVTGTVSSGASKAQGVTIIYTVPAAPTAAISSPAAGGTYNLNAVVTSAFSCVEGSGSPGLESCTDSNGGSGTAGVLATSTAGAHTYTVTALSKDGETATASIAYTVAAPPTAAISAPVTGGNYPQNAFVKSAFTCAEGVDGSGIESCTDSNGGSGTTGNLATSTLGTHSYTVTAKSKDGQTGTATISYTVAAPPKPFISAPATGGPFNLNAVVKTAFTCTEGTGGTGVASCVDSNGASGGAGTLATAVAGAHAYKVTATSTDGQAGIVTLGYTVAAPPTSVITSPAGGGVYAPGAVVKSEFSCVEGLDGSGVESCSDSNGGSGVAGVLETSALGSHSYTVTAKSTDGQTGTASVTYTVAAAPTAAISSPVIGGTYAQNAVVKSAFSCAEGASGSGIESCTDSNGGSGAAGVLQTSTLGAHTYTVTAKSLDGQTGTATVPYTVTSPVIPPVEPPVSPPVVAPVVPTVAALVTLVPAATLTFSTAACVSDRTVTIFVANQVTLPRGVRIVRAEVLLAGRAVAKLPGPYPVAHVSLVGLPKGAYTVTSMVRASNGTLRKGLAVFQTCTSGAGR